jgi:hypothetical protein
MNVLVQMLAMCLLVAIVGRALNESHDSGIRRNVEVFALEIAGLCP